MARIREVEKAIKQQLDLAGLTASHKVSKQERSQHYLIRDPDNLIVVSIPCSPGDHRWLKHLRCDVRRAARRYNGS